jgi:fatty acid desaturase
MNDRNRQGRTAPAPEPTRPERRLFAHSRWDVIPVGLAAAHLAAVLGLVFSFERLSWAGFVGLGLLYAISISWSINSIAHNFIHNPYFVSPILNRSFSLMLSLTIGFSQAMYHYVHLWHHAGNSDRPAPDGTTIDYLSIYRHGRNGRAESPWGYVFLSYFRDDLSEILGKIASRRPDDALFGKVELACVAVFYTGLLAYDWRALVCLVPFYYLGHCLSSLNGYYEHFGADPDRPIAWGVSSYGRLYNWTWMNNGYHAEHHYRPKHHWTQMPALHKEIAAAQQAAGVRVIRRAHALGFLDRSLPTR